MLFAYHYLELGILVWQDFQFACGVYPAHPEFVDNVRKEAIYNVNRLKHHPSMALFCGNNEGQRIVMYHSKYTHVRWRRLSTSLTVGRCEAPLDETFQHIDCPFTDVPDLPARLLYEDILTNLVKDLTGGNIAYHPGSPYGGEGWDTTDPTVGDIHQWDIWAGKELAWQYYGLMGGRFVRFVIFNVKELSAHAHTFSEFGIPAMPDIRTVDHWLEGHTDERWVGSQLMAQHCRAGSHERRFAIVMNDNFRPTSDLET